MPLALKDTLGDKLYDAYISSMLTPFSKDEVRLMERKTLYHVRKKCGNAKTFYRFGFNGKEQDPELKGKHNVQDYGFRMNETRYGSFFSVDQFSVKYPMLSTYRFASNSPIANSDLDGLEALLKIYQWNQDGSACNLNATYKNVDPSDPNQNPWAKGHVVSIFDHMTVTLNNDGTIQGVDIFKTTSPIDRALNFAFKPIDKILEVGNKMEQVGFGTSVETKNSIVYGKLSLESYSTSEENVGFKEKLETGVRGDIGVKITNKNKIETVLNPVKNFKEINKASMEGRFYFFFGFRKPNTEAGGSIGVSTSISNTTKIPIYGTGGLYQFYDFVSQKCELGFYFSTDKSMKFQESGTMKLGVKQEMNSGLSQAGSSIHELSKSIERK